MKTYEQFITESGDADFAFMNSIKHLLTPEEMKDLKHMRSLLKYGQSLKRCLNNGRLYKNCDLYIDDDVKKKYRETIKEILKKIKDIE